jgi:hypothetical protein
VSVSALPDARLTPLRWKSPILATATNVSGNTKIGDAGATYAAQASCPSSCPFKDGGGCYAETGRIGKFVTRELNASAEVLNADTLAIAQAEADAIDDLTITRGRPLRLHTVGDCASDEAAQIVSAAAARYMERGGGQVWTYTHAWRDVAHESWGGVSVLASCESGDDVRLARSLGYAPSIVVEQFESDKLTAGVLPCPAQTRGRTCTSCRLCFDDLRILDRGYAIGFELHGIPYAVRQARLALRHPDDPMRRVPSEQRVRLIRERYLALGREPTCAEIAEELDLNTASVYEWLRFIRGETVHPAERRQRARKAAK